MHLFTKKNVIFWIVVAAAFFLMLRSSQPVKWADALFVTAGILTFLHRRARTAVVEFWPQIAIYILPLLAIAIFIVIGQFIGFLRHGPPPASANAIVLNYARLALEMGMLLFLACAISTGQRLVHYLSLAVFASPLVIIPIFWGTWQDILLSNGRLSGFLQSPIILGSWLSIIFIIGVGIFLSSKVLWQKMAAASWLVVIANFILWSASRAAWLSLAVSIIIWSVLYLKKKSFKKCLVILALSISVFYLGYLLFCLGARPTPAVQAFVSKRVAEFITHPTASQVRHLFWLEAVDIIFRNPLGVGFGYYPIIADGKLIQPFNTFLEVAVYGGIGALTAFLLFFYRMGISIRATLEDLLDQGADLKLAWLVAVPALLVNIFFADSIFFRHVWVTLGVALGISWQTLIKNKSDQNH